MQTIAPAQPDDFGNHKDGVPPATVARVRAILKSLGIGEKIPLREKWVNSAPQCFSMRLTDPGYPMLCTHGKGVTKDYCRASAYAELMERLQCCFSIWFSRLGNILSAEPLHPDERDVLVTKLWREAPDIMHELVENEGGIPVHSLPCLPFWDIVREKEKLLPFELMFWKTYSTGMCAGNTAEESLVQGICEIMERHAARKVMDETLIAPTIPGEHLNRCSRGLRRMITELKNSGLKLVVKDCTMGGSLPVLAAIVIDEANDRFGLDFGSDPVFDVALQRCITELYQGRKKLTFSFSSWKQELSPPKDFFNNVHAALSGLLVDVPTAQYQEAFVDKIRSNVEYLRFLMDKVQGLGAKVYVRDFSWLGFPSHYVYIQGLPSQECLKFEESQFILRDAGECLDIVFRIHEEDKEAISRLAHFYAGKLRRETPFSGSLTNSLSAPFFPVPVAQWLDSRTFTAFVLIEADFFEDALDVLENDPSVSYESPEKDLWALLAEYCRLSKLNISCKEVQSRLTAKYGQGPYGLSIPHLMSRHWTNLYMKEPAGTQGRKFEGLPIPRCSNPFSCFACPMNGKCLLNRFIEIRGKCIKAYRLIDQTRLGHLFSN